MLGDGVIHRTTTKVYPLLHSVGLCVVYALLYTVCSMLHGSYY